MIFSLNSELELSLYFLFKVSKNCCSLRPLLTIAAMNECYPAFPARSRVDRYEFRHALVWSSLPKLRMYWTMA